MQQRIVEAEVATGAAKTRTSAAVRGQSRYPLDGAEPVVSCASTARSSSQAPEVSARIEMRDVDRTKCAGTLTCYRVFADLQPLRN